METNIEGRKIVFRSLGDQVNIPVVMVPEMGRPAADFEILSTKLVEAGYWTLLLDLPYIDGGTGSNANIEIEDIASDIYMFLNEYGVEKAHFIGHGFGAMLIRQMAELYPQRLLSITCISMYGVLPFPKEYYQVIEMIEKKMCQTIEFEQAIARLFFADKSDSSIWFHHWYSDSIRAYLLAVARSPREENIKAGVAPILVVQGEQDIFTPLRAGEIIKGELNAQVRLINISEAGHEILHEQPEQLLNSIVIFLRDVNENNFYVNFNQDSDQKRFTHLEAIETNCFEECADFFTVHIRDGMKILDCGSGTGSMTMELGKLNKGGIVTGIDNDPIQIKIATDKMQQKSLDNVEFLEADVYNLPFKDGTYDAVWMNMLLMHLNNPLVAVREAIRILKPGGVLAVSDVDWDGNIMAPNYQIILARMHINEKLMKKNGSNMRHGKYNFGLLHKAGLKNVSASVRLENWGNKGAVREFADIMVDSEQVYFSDDASKMAINMRRESWDNWASYSGAFFVRTYCRAIGWKNENVCIVGDM